MALRCCFTSLVLWIAIACGFVAFILDGVTCPAAQLDCVDNLIVKNGFFTGDAFWSGRVRNVADCAVACVRRSLCMGFNYDPMENLCEMFGAPFNQTIQLELTLGGYKQFSYIANWTTSEVDPNCFERPCPINAVCVPGNFSTLFSVDGDCPYTCINFTMLCPKPSASFSGPRSVGSTFTCDNGQNSTCLESLQWNDTCTM